MTDEQIAIETLTVDELANVLLDRLRVDVMDANLEDGLEPDGVKFLSAVRKIAHEDPQAVADGFVALSFDAAAMEDQLNMFKQLLGQKFNLADMFGGEPEEQN